MKRLSLINIAVIAAIACLVGCAGDSARRAALEPAISGAWPSVKEDAELGVKARTTPAAAAALGVTPESAGVAQQRQDRISEFDAAVGTLKH